MHNKTINIGTVAEVAEALKQYKDQIVFVGGSVISLYTDDPAADEIRPTKDIDLTINIIDTGEFQETIEELGKLGFHPDPFGASICSYRYDKIPVDIIPAEDNAFGSTNRWYKIGFENLWKVKAKEQEINILSAPCFLATKFEAFNSRGKDYRTSHDIEDIIYIIDNRTTIAEEIAKADGRISAFLKAEIQKIIDRGLLDELLHTHIHPLIIDERMDIVKEKINAIMDDIE
ncbi:nucleotidyl transferase AbiEii/AbiGii toxin family protein [Chryseobacterium indologenes]|uniref:nucleotidyl transferase AbiEii/AbiGii toxin family protein n=1 Tax=Chryseobacterium indologenes TaxID=253 RepID=UPI001107AA32|nr:nucleotidyl transferase AbiEii/AbiGii toxin family protein [Chryseobacterium indologenes]TLX27423.1 nucleotidyl transferase AbiEii/AbiGii toxin family protein [Chryseobacterium indologenes]